MFSEGWTTDTVAAYMGPPALAVRMICSSEEPITTKTKNPSMTGPTEKPYLDFSLALMSTRPRLWMFLWNLAEEAAKTRLEAACARGETAEGGAPVSCTNETSANRCARERERGGARRARGHRGGETPAVPNNSRALPDRGIWARGVRRRRCGRRSTRDRSGSFARAHHD